MNVVKWLWHQKLHRNTWLLLWWLSITLVTGVTSFVGPLSVNIENLKGEIFLKQLYMMAQISLLAYRSFDSVVAQVEKWVFRSDSNWVVCVTRSRQAQMHENLIDYLWDLSHINCQSFKELSGPERVGSVDTCLACSKYDWSHQWNWCQRVLNIWVCASRIFVWSHGKVGVNKDEFKDIEGHVKDGVSSLGKVETNLGWVPSIHWEWCYCPSNVQHLSDVGGTSIGWCQAGHTDWHLQAL